MKKAKRDFVIESFDWLIIPFWLTLSGVAALFLEQTPRWLALVLVLVLAIWGSLWKKRIADLNRRANHLIYEESKLRLTLESISYDLVKVVLEKPEARDFSRLERFFGFLPEYAMNHIAREMHKTEEHVIQRISYGVEDPAYALYNENFRNGKAAYWDMADKLAAAKLREKKDSWKKDLPEDIKSAG